MHVGLDQDGTKVAIKLLNGDGEYSSKLLNNEIEALKALNHKNIV